MLCLLLAGLLLPHNFIAYTLRRSHSILKRRVVCMLPEPLVLAQFRSTSPAIPISAFLIPLVLVASNLSWLWELCVVAVISKPIVNEMCGWYIHPRDKV